MGGGDGLRFFLIDGGMGEGKGLEHCVAFGGLLFCGPGGSRVWYLESAVLKAGRVRALPTRPRIEETWPAL